MTISPHENTFNEIGAYTGTNSLLNEQEDVPKKLED